MDMTHVEDEYFALLESYVGGQEEAQLARASELGRKLVQSDCPPEQVGEIFEAAVLRLAQASPDMPLLKVVNLITAPLTEVLMAYGLAFREHLVGQVRKLSHAVQQSPSIVVITDTDGNIEYVNPRFTQVTGYSREEVIGKKPAILESGETPPERYRQLWENITSGGEWKGEYLNKKKNGELFWESASISPIRDDAGAIVHFVAVIEDITERKRLEDQSRQTQKMEVMGQLAAGIAHDLNNILTCIIGFSELVGREPNLSDEARADLARVTGQGRRASALIRQILDFSRKSIIRRQLLDLAPCVKDTAELLRRTIPETIRIALEIEPTELAVQADATQVQQVLTNLAVNARDAMPEGGELTLGLCRLSLKRGEPPPLPELPPGEWVVISVSDSGTGVPPEVLPHIFEPFFTTKSPDQGTGLGLSQVYGIVKQHEGHIDVESRVGEGTTFTIYLPGVVPGKEAAEEEASPAQTRGGGELVLVVEDEQDVRDACKRMLEHLGYRVLTAADGQQALDVYAEHQDEIALILTDAVLPHFGGVALVRALRAENPGVGVLITSGYPLGEEAQELLTLREVDWIQKPWDLDKLAEAVSRALG